VLLVDLSVTHILLSRCSSSFLGSARLLSRSDASRGRLFPEIPHPSSPRPASIWPITRAGEVGPAAAAVMRGGASSGPQRWGSAGTTPRSLSTGSSPRGSDDRSSDDGEELVEVTLDLQDDDTIVLRSVVAVEVAVDPEELVAPAAAVLAGAQGGGHGPGAAVLAGPDQAVRPQPQPQRSAGAVGPRVRARRPRRAAAARAARPHTLRRPQGAPRPPLHQQQQGQQRLDGGAGQLRPPRPRRLPLPLRLRRMHRYPYPPIAHHHHFSPHRIAFSRSIRDIVVVQG
jgi:hypothetical protein